MRYPRFRRKNKTWSAAVAALLLAACSTVKLDDRQQSLLHSSEQAGATDLKAVPLADGGTRLTGKLDGREFYLLIPWRWNGEAVLYTPGYTVPGTPRRLPEDPLQEDRLGLNRTPYGERYAVGRSAYDKAGMGVQTAVENTYRLKQLVQKLGTSRVYVIGGSMGGSIAMALVEKHPDDFAGALAACGVVGDWETEIGHLTDVRAAYNYFTRGTPYEMPGDKDLSRSGLSTLDWAGFAWPLNQLWQGRRIVKPVAALFDAAAKNPQGPERRIIDNIAAVSGAEPDPASFVLPLITLILGMDDFNATLGGSIYDNSAKIYYSPYLSPQENAALNTGIQRIKADPGAVAYVDQWYKTTGRFNARVLTLYNSIDPEVPSPAEEALLRERAARSGTGELLVQRAVPPLRQNLLPGSKIEGYAHCGFNAGQIAQAWDDLHRWVETGKKPQ